ncbi:hypothetical protein CWI40_030990 [Ordospora colligata]|nr:hypothetical protein CWI40_030990 [Ordospora colligata]
MLIARVRLPNKPLVVLTVGECIYIGDAHGVLYVLNAPYTSAVAVFQSVGPISALVFSDNRLYYGNWDGDVGVVDGNKINFGSHIVKCMAVHEGLIYASVGDFVYALDFNLVVVNAYKVEHKVLCMSVFEGVMYCGMGVPFVARIDDNITTIGKSAHETSIFCMCGEYTGSADGIVMRQDYSDLERHVVVYKGKEWIRSMYSQYLFSEGKNIVADVDGIRYRLGTGLKNLYSHEADVVGVTVVESKIISIGLDYMYYVYDIGFGFEMSEEEAREISELMGS